MTGNAHLTLSDVRIAYEIGIPFDGARAADAVLSGPMSELRFSLASPTIAVHLPGNEQGILNRGGTLYTGVIELSEEARSDLIAGWSTLSLSGVRIGGSSVALTGRVQPIPEPGILLLCFSGVLVMYAVKKLEIGVGTRKSNKSIHANRRPALTFRMDCVDRTLDSLPARVSGGGR